MIRVQFAIAAHHIVKCRTVMDSTQGHPMCQAVEHLRVVGVGGASQTLMLAFPYLSQLSNRAVAQAELLIARFFHVKIEVFVGSR